MTRARNKKKPNQLKFWEKIKAVIESAEKKKSNKKKEEDKDMNAIAELICYDIKLEDLINFLSGLESKRIEEGERVEAEIKAAAKAEAQDALNNPRDKDLQEKFKVAPDVELALLLERKNDLNDTISGFKSAQQHHQNAINTHTGNLTRSAAQWAGRAAKRAISYAKRLTMNLIKKGIRLVTASGKPANRAVGTNLINVIKNTPPPPTVFKNAGVQQALKNALQLSMAASAIQSGPAPAGASPVAQALGVPPPPPPPPPAVMKAFAERNQQLTEVNTQLKQYACLTEKGHDLTPKELMTAINLNKGKLVDLYENKGERQVDVTAMAEAIGDALAIHHHQGCFNANQKTLEVLEKMEKQLDVEIESKQSASMSASRGR